MYCAILFVVKAHRFKACLKNIGKQHFLGISSTQLAAFVAVIKHLFVADAKLLFV